MLGELCADLLPPFTQSAARLGSFAQSPGLQALAVVSKITFLLLSYHIAFVKGFYSFPRFFKYTEVCNFWLSGQSTFCNCFCKLTDTCAMFLRVTGFHLKKFEILKEQRCFLKSL